MKATTEYIVKGTATSMGLRKDAAMNGMTVNIEPKNSLAPPVVGVVIDAYSDIVGVVKYIKILKSDGRMDWYDVTSAIVEVIRVVVEIADDVAEVAAGGFWKTVTGWFSRMVKRWRNK